jgi:hypothetical protein
LYHVLNENQSLVSVVIPHLWRDAQSGSLELEIPSSIELSQAFIRLGAESTDGAYAFFIDGLDEFSGNHRDGIAFVQKLATSANIKVLLSSRPIDTCVAAFSSRPKLALQDLTKHDIQLYVDDTIRSHSYIADVKALDESVVDPVTDDLQKKADGVFLWVVLACRTLIKGFAVFDSTKELQTRVDELPPELEDLFRHILGRIPVRFLHQTAKLLRICYNCRLLQISDRISTLALAWADEKDLDIDQLNDFIEHSSDENWRKCAMLEGRLRSRCMGLLEIHTSASHRRSTSGTDLIGSSIDFMHRTVFEFLNLPGVWEAECLQVGDGCFDETIVLSYMSSYLLFLQQKEITFEGSLLARQSLAYVQLIEQESPTKVPCTINRFTHALIQPRYEAQAHSTSPLQITPAETPISKRWSFNQVSSQHAALLLAV